MLVLSVIGVIAALTIPGLVQNLNSNQNKTVWKKSFSEINQAIQSIMVDNDGSMKNLNCYDWNCFHSELVKRMKVLKDCPSGASNGPGKCWNNWGVDGGAFILSNGTLVKPEWASPSCDNNTWHGTLPKCGMIWVDVNGFKGPAKFGVDMFVMQVVSEGIKPMGVDGDGFAGICNPQTGTDYGCSAKYLIEK